MLTSKDTVKGTPQQNAIWKHLRNEDGHIVVQARAGTGKTFTCIHGLKKMKPRKANEKRGIVAFNKSIATELERKIPIGVDASTFHALCLKVLLAERDGQLKIDGRKVSWLIQDNFPKVKFAARISIEKVVSLCKNTLTNPTNEKAVESMCDRYGCDFEGNQAEVLGLVPKVMELSWKDEERIDYDDMLFIPYMADLPVEKFRYDVLFVDEAQDLNRVQQEMALRLGRRLIFVGDDRQAIYGFRGADTDSLSNMTMVLRKSDLGCDVFPLTASRRCPTSHVGLASLLVQDFKAMPKAPEGRIIHSQMPGAIEEMEPGDLALCRVNAPLCGTAYALLRAGVPAKIQGRDIGRGLTTLINKLGEEDVTDMLSALMDYEDREETRIRNRIAKGRAGSGSLMALRDKCECLRVLAEGVSTTKDLIGVIRDLFADADPVTGLSRPAVLLSSVHRAKGIEAGTVHVLCPELMPHPLAKKVWEREQELNIAYVAVTRSLDTLNFVGELPPAFG